MDEKSQSNNLQLFIAEWNSLRGEITQRLTQQTQFCQIAVTAFGVIAGVSLDGHTKDDFDWHSHVFILCLYPVLAYLLSFSWAFNQTRICQLASYLRQREDEIAPIGKINWENHIKDEPGRNEAEGIAKLLKTKPGMMLFTGTQAATILIAIIMLILHADTTMDRTLAVVLFVLVFDIGLTILTYYLVKQSGRLIDNQRK